MTGNIDGSGQRWLGTMVDPPSRQQPLHYPQPELGSIIKTTVLNRSQCLSKQKKNQKEVFTNLKKKRLFVRRNPRFSVVLFYFTQSLADATLVISFISSKCLTRIEPFIHRSNRVILYNFHEHPDHMLSVSLYAD